MDSNPTPQSSGIQAQPQDTPEAARRVSPWLQAGSQGAGLAGLYALNGSARLRDVEQEFHAQNNLRTLYEHGAHGDAALKQRLDALSHGFASGQPDMAEAKELGTALKTPINTHKDISTAQTRLQALAKDRQLGMGDAYIESTRKVVRRLPAELRGTIVPYLRGSEGVTWSGVPNTELGLRNRLVAMLKGMTTGTKPVIENGYDRLYSSDFAAKGHPSAIDRGLTQGQKHLHPMLEGKGQGVLISELLTGLPHAGHESYPLDPHSRARLNNIQNYMTTALGPQQGDLRHYTHTDNHTSFSSRMGDLHNRLDTQIAGNDPKAKSAARVLKRILTESHAKAFNTNGAPGPYALNWDATSGRSGWVNKSLKGAHHAYTQAGLGAAGLSQYLAWKSIKKRENAQATAGQPG